MDSPILTIAIPTWNRAPLLAEALDILQKQLSEQSFTQKIQIIISDNASTDNTNEAIKGFCENNPLLNIVHHTQDTNTGYFGNFRKCRELSTGAYFWLLSDNDHLADGVIEHIFQILESNKPSFIFLEDWKHSRPKPRKSGLMDEELSISEAIERFNYRTTLISAVIFLNNKKEDTALMETFKGNTFIGFMYFLQSLDYSRKAIGIKGTSLFIRDTKVSFNAFKSFSVDLTACMKYAEDHGYMSKELANKFMDSVIAELTVKHYIYFRLTGKLHGMNPGNKNEVNAMLTSGFGSFSAFQSKLKPLQESNQFQFLVLVFTRHFFRLLKEKMNF